MTQRTPEARAAADMILALLKKHDDHCRYAVSVAATEVGNAKPCGKVEFRFQTMSGGKSAAK